MDKLRFDGRVVIVTGGGRDIVQLGNGGYLGLTSALGIQIDDTADGYGWYVGAAPGNDAAYSRLLAPGELQATPGSQAFGRPIRLLCPPHKTIPPVRILTQ